MGAGGKENEIPRDFLSPSWKWSTRDGAPELLDGTSPHPTSPSRSSYNRFLLTEKRNQKEREREKWQMAKTETCHFITILSNNLLLSSMSEFFYKEIFLKKYFMYYFEMIFRSK
jgi:hypothetical protein